MWNVRALVLVGAFSVLTNPSLEALGWSSSECGADTGGVLLLLAVCCRCMVRGEGLHLASSTRPRTTWGTSKFLTLSLVFSLNKLTSDDQYSIFVHLWKVFSWLLWPGLKLSMQRRQLWVHNNAKINVPGTYCLWRPFTSFLSLIADSNCAKSWWGDKRTLPDI